jgi:hypothetical protein
MVLNYYTGRPDPPFGLGILDSSDVAAVPDSAPARRTNPHRSVRCLGCP